MANLTVNEVVPPIEPMYEYILTLNQEEYEALMVLVGSVSGNPNHPLLRVAREIWSKAFREICVENDLGRDLKYYPKMKIGYSANVS